MTYNLRLKKFITLAVKEASTFASAYPRSPNHNYENFNKSYLNFKR